MCAKEVIAINPNFELLKKWERRVWESEDNNTCIVCKKNNKSNFRKYTCSEECHKKFLQELINDFGEYKKITDMTTGKTYKVPIKEIFEHGIKQENLKNYSIMEE